MSKNMDKKDVVGIGNAIVDIITDDTDEFLHTNNIKKGSMKLCNEKMIESVSNSRFLIIGGAGSIGQAVSKEIFKSKLDLFWAGWTPACGSQPPLPHWAKLSGSGPDLCFCGSEKLRIW